MLVITCMILLRIIIIIIVVLHIIMVVLNISSYNSPEKSYIVRLWFACFSLAFSASNPWLQVAA